MTRFKHVLALSALSAAALSPLASAQTMAPTAAAKTYDLHDFFRKPEKSRFRLSPDGKHVAFLARNNGRLNVFVQTLAGNGTPADDAKALTAESARDVSNFIWKGNAHIVYAKDFGGDENFHLLLVPIGGDAAGKDLTPFDGARAQIVDGLEDDDKHLLISHNQRDKKVFDVYRVDIATGDSELVAQNPGNITDWVTDHHGRLRAAVVTDGVSSSVLYRDDEKAPFKTIVETDFREAVQPYFFTFDDKRLYVSSNRGRDKKAIFEFDPKTAREGKLVYENADVDVGSLDFSRKRKTLTEVGYVDWKSQHQAMEPVTKGIYDDLGRKLPGYDVALGGHTRDEKRFIVVAYSDRTRGKTFVYDAPTKKLVLLAESTPWLAEADMAPMKPITYQSRDGLTIHGYLTLPSGKEPKNLPMIVNPHGGPWARDVWRFSPEVQFLANRGYAVLQMNFRGSTGYGRKFWEASFKQWGRAMQDDITDGVEAMKQQGVADPKRIAIYGGSYGGYAVLSGVTTTPDLYAAAVDYVGVANLVTILKNIPPYWEAQRRQFYEMMGDPVKDKELVEDASPVNHLDRIKTPLFVAQGARDPRVNKTESDQIVEGLRKRGVTVEYMVKDNEGHGFQNEENQFDFYGAMEKFLAQNLKP
jgi:dipeptidyl aminopeptidase/acylaminoacyl peptidase